MADVKDMDLVREYADRNSEPAFAELVRRHINLVYSVAMRFAGNDADAHDIVQAVFIILARRAASLRSGTILTGWLYETTRFTAMNFLRTRVRQQVREQEAYMQSTLNEADSDAAWKQLGPLLEDAMTRLNEKERTLLALRFFENKTGAEAAAAVGIQEWAAHKRIERAVEKLRKFFIRRGVVLSAGVVASAISSNSLQVAPAALAHSVTVAALAKGAAAGGSTLTLIKGALKLMAWSKAKTAVITGAVILLTASVGLVAVGTIHSHQSQPNIQGAWEGISESTLGKIRVVLNIRGTNGTYQASIDSIDQRAKDIPVNTFDYNYPSLQFDCKAVGGSFIGKFNPGTDELAGTWKQMGMEAHMVVKRTATPTAVPELLTESDYAPRAGSDLQGYWKGALQMGPTLLHLVVKISEPENGKYIAEMDSTDQGAINLVVSSVTYDKPSVQMEVSTVGGEFDGKVSSDHQEIAGTWTQAGNTMPLTIKRGDPKVDQAQAAARDANKDFSHANPDDLTGHWKGALDVQGMKLHLALHVGKLPNGDLSGSLDSIDQGAKDMPANRVRFTAPNVHLEWNMIGGVYDGKIKGGKISGKWKQGGQTFPLVFARSSSE